MSRFEATCSNCGQKQRIRVDFEELYNQGFRAVGDTLYCPECVRTWADRNGQAFDSRYGRGYATMARWMINHQGRLG